MSISGGSDPRPENGSESQAAALLQKPEFRALIRQQRTMSLSLTALMLLLYFGFILLIAYRKDILAQRLGEHLTLGLPLGVGLILVTCLLTGIYVRWANTSYDAQVHQLRSGLGTEP